MAKKMPPAERAKLDRMMRTRYRELRASCLAYRATGGYCAACTRFAREMAVRPQDFVCLKTGTYTKELPPCSTT